MPGALSALLHKLAGENGIELDDDELAKLGLGDDAGPFAHADPNILTIPLPGSAAGEVEIYCADTLSTSTGEPVEEKDSLMWYPIIRSGQWAVRPGTQGKKRRAPLRVIEGNSKNQRKEIGLADLKSAFDDEAIQHVTVPSSHANTTLENTGFIRAMKIIDGEFKNKSTKQTEKCKVLMGGYDITEPDVKGKLKRGTIANRSAGILYDYVNTETGKTYPAVVEHVALTNKPWITGMVSFGRPLSEGGIQTVGLSLSDEPPYSEEEYAEVLSLEATELTDEDRDFLAVSGVAWDHETSPSWLQTQVNQLLAEARSKKLKAKRNNGATVLYEDYPPNYRCVEAKPGQALIRDGWGDDANAWIAGIIVKDGAVNLDDFTKWTAVAKVYMPDDRAAPPKDKLPLAEQQPVIEREPLSRLELAQLDRKQRARGEQGPNQNNDTPRGGGNMAGETGAVLSELPPEAQRAIQEAERRAREAEERATKLDERVQRLTGTVNTGEVTSYLAWLKSDEGLGLTEERGFSGALAELSQLMLADDGEPAVQSDHFATDGGSGELTLSEAFKRFLGAVHKATEGKKSLGEMLSQPADPQGEEFELDAEGNPKLDAEGNKIPKAKAPAPEGSTNADEAAGKPPAAGKADGEELSTEAKVDKIIEASPEVARVLGRAPVAAGADKGGAA